MRTCFMRVCAALFAVAPLAAAGQDTVTVVAGERYRVGGLKRVLMGTGYRDAWTAPMRVPVLDLRRTGGGLTPTEEGGGKGTESLRFHGADGMEYLFRSTDKTARRALPPDLQGSIVEDLAQDQTSAKHPASALAVPPILDVVGILHVAPTLYVMPDDPGLGGFREKWRGRLGILELRLEDDLAGRLFPGAEDMESTEDFLEKLEEDPRNRVDAHDYLKARLVDMWLGDWDRHPDQWRWARFDRGDARVWRPVPRDRDNAFARYEGLVIAATRSSKPNLTRFGPRLDAVYGLHFFPASMDRRFLPLIERAEWDSLTTWVQARLTDQLIDEAIGRMPPEYRRLHGDMLRRNLRTRRDDLPGASATLYGIVTRQADLHASDAAERARITRRADGALEVVITPPSGPATRRLFVPAETDEVRVYLHGGDDVAEVDGPPSGAIRLRLIGGGGDDRLVERSASGGPSNQRFYDHRGQNTLTPGRGAADTRDWEAPLSTQIGGDPRPPRDYGSSSSWLTPSAGFESNVGLVVGVGPSFTHYGFRQVPFASRWRAAAVYAPAAPHGYGAEVLGAWFRTGRPASLTLSLRGNRFETSRFHGFGNDSESGTSHGLLVRHDFAGAELMYNDSIRGGWTMAVGPTFQWRDPNPQAGSPASAGVRGGESYTTGGARTRFTWDRRDTLAITRSGSYWLAEAVGAAWSDGAPYGRIHTEARMYVPLVGGGPSLALRVGGERAVGEFPFQEAAVLGGRSRLRGYSLGRYTGDAASWAGAELRQPLGTIHLLVRGRLGLVALADAGRVWMDGESPGGWHTGVGGGLWMEVLGKAATVTYAYGDAGKFYLTMGPSF